MQFTSVTFTALAVVSASFLAPAESTNLREQLRVGQQVKVEGQVQDGAFHAQHITLRDAENTVKVEGAIDEVSDGGRQIQLLDFAVAVDRSTRLYRGNQPTSSRSMLVRGAWIEAKGTWRHGVLKATRVRLKSSPEPTQEIEGIIQFADSSQSTLLILDRAVHVPQDAVIVDERTGAAVGDQSGRLRRDDDDAGGRAPIAFGNVIAGGRVEAGFLNEENFDVGQRDIERTVLARVQVLASAQVTESIEAYTKITMSQNVIPGSSTRGDARLSEGYLMFHRLGGAPVDLQIGRQRFRDSREWIFDDYLDAARVHVNLPAVRLEAAVSRGIFSGDERVRERRDQLQFFASAVTHVGAAQVGGYALARRDTTRDERPIWIGGRLNGRAGINWNYWGDVVARRGASRASRLAGWAFDTGVKHTWSQRWSPTVTVGYAFGSGDQTRGDGRDTRFRQTDLEDNRAYFGGLRRVAIYGELFDPELSNLRVFTVGFGVRPRRNFAVDAIYHRSAQAIATTALPSSNLDGSLEGRQGALGDELNVVFTLRAVPGVDFDLAVGAFLPGRAFGAARTSAFFWRPQLRFSF
jgi:hypothetical protein